LRIEHLAVWSEDIERLRAFYETYFAARAGKKYTNPNTGFQSYFLSFADGPRLEIMQAPDVLPAGPYANNRITGLAHFAVAVGSEAAVDALTARLAADGFTVAGTPRRTGDGYYESVILDPDQNRVEITAG